jgi:hypothetical protein
VCASGGVADPSGDAAARAAAGSVYLEYIRCAATPTEFRKEYRELRVKQMGGAPQWPTVVTVLVGNDVTLKPAEHRLGRVWLSGPAVVTPASPDRTVDIAELWADSLGASVGGSHEEQRFILGRGAGILYVFDSNEHTAFANFTTTFLLNDAGCTLHGGGVATTLNVGAGSTLNIAVGTVLGFSALSGAGSISTHDRIFGCTHTYAENWNPVAVQHSDECVYVQPVLEAAAANNSACSVERAPIQAVTEAIEEDLAVVNETFVACEASLVLGTRNGEGAGRRLWR